MGGDSVIYNIDNVKEILGPIFKYHNVKRAVLFGSIILGENQINSDIDIMVDSGLKGLSFFGLLEDVCNSVECKVDMIDTQDIVAGSEIDKEIQRTGVVIYEAA